MKIAIIKPTETISPTGGVKVQGEMWKQGLEQLGHSVNLVGNWDNVDWKSFDIILFIQFGGILRGMVNALYPINSNLVIAPIIDTNFSVFQFKLICRYFGNTRIKLSNIFHDFYSVKDKFKLYLVRSEYEKKYVTQSLGVSEDRVKIIPLAYRVTPPASVPIKENFCFHASLLADERKNVSRLIKAAQKYKFKLVLAGNIRSTKEKEWLSNLLNGYDNISYVGRVSDTQLFDFYSKAKVFALPSINEGVGMVALEAATYGCEIVLTNLGAPKEYYNGMAYLINPYDIDSIGKAVMNALEGKGNHQPQLKEHIIRHYNPQTCYSLLEESFKRIL